MVRHSHILLTALVALLAWPPAGLAASAQSPVPDQKRHASRDLRGGPGLPSLVVSSIQGLVVDAAHQPVPQVRVRVLGPASVVATTDPDGRFHIASLPAGRYLVRAYSAGFRAATSGVIELRDGGGATLQLMLLDVATAEAAVSQSAAPPVELAAGFGASDAAGQIGRLNGVDGSGPFEAGDGTDGTDAPETERRADGELAWRLRRLRRSPLKDAETAAGPDGAGAGFPPEAATAVERALGASVRMASTLFDDTLTGEVNLLTSGAFDSPEQLFSSNRFARNVTYASVGASAGEIGTWAVRGAMTQGDVSSWILAGVLTAPAISPHAYDIGMSYSTQRYNGRNAAALAAVSDGARNAADIYGFDRWSVSPRLVLGYGTRFSRYDYLAGGGWLSPRMSATVTPVDRFRVHVLAARRTVAPGAEEFVPGISTGLWLPPERTFSALVVQDGFRVERNDHYEVGLEHDLASTLLVAVRVYEQTVQDQLATLFHVRQASAGPTDLGHYYVATAGDVQTHGWAARVSHEIGSVRSAVEYAQSRAVWEPGRQAAEIARRAPSAVREDTEDLVDITTSVQAQIPQTATRLFVLYRVSNGFASMDDVRMSGRFNVQINQALPFLNFNSAEWEMLVDVRNLFRDPVADASQYDELLVVNPPKRIVGGILVRF